MIHSTSSNHFFTDLFTPISPESTEEKKEKKDVLDRVAEYTDTASGARDVFRIGNYIFSVIELTLSPLNKFAGTVGKIKEVFNAAGIGLSMPQIFSDINSLRGSISDFFRMQNLPYNDSLRERKVAQAAKKSFLDTMNLTGTVTQIILFADNAKIFIFEAVHLRIVDGIFNITGAIVDGAELVGECFKLKQYHSLDVHTQREGEATKLQEKKTLSWLLIAKNVASVALAAISLGVIVSGVAAGNVLAFPVVVLGLSGFWLTMKLATYFYNKVIVESPIVSSSKPI